MSTFANTVSAFQTWQNLTREVRIGGPEDIINDAVQNTYLLGEMLRGRDTDHVIRGGSYISERIKLVDSGTYAEYTPGQPRTLGRTTTVFKMNVPYRFGESHDLVVDAEMDLNEGDPQGQFKSYDRVIRMDMMSDHWNGIEKRLFAKPDQGNMEAGSAGSGAVSPGKPYSIPTFFTEDGLVPPANNGTFTTIQGLSPSTYSNYASPYSTYDTTTLDDADNGLFAAFDKLWVKLEFKTPPGLSAYTENDNLRKLKIVTNSNGLVIYMARLRTANNQLVGAAGPQDPAYGMPVYRNVPVYHATVLDGSDCLLEQNPVGTYTNVAYPDGRPRYFFLNLQYVYPVFHKKWFMREVTKDGGASQRDVTAMFYVSWWNLVCRSRKRGGGVVRPAA